jgi:two-component system, OmpR family, response regulator
MRILLVEDEPEMGRLVASLVAEAQFIVDRSGSLEETIEAAARANYGLILLDRRLPDGDGLSIVADLRRLRPGVRIIMLTALDSLDDTICGLDAGADDYLAKPFRGPELMARIRACLRRPGAEPQPSLAVANLALDLASREVTIGGRPVGLHRRELALLEALMRRADRVIAREALLDEVYGLDAEIQPHTLDTLVWRLRKRLESFGAGVTIHLARGIGYMLTESAR